jgi:hypothetical protein
MARRPGWTQAQWEAHGADAIVDLVHDRQVVTWAEVEARIAVQGWKDFRPVQPIQLSGSLNRLRDEVPSRIIEEWSRHPSPVHTLRTPFSEDVGNKRRLMRQRGRLRKAYQHYISWTQDEALCGRHAEHVVLASLKTVSDRAGLWVPAQTPGQVRAIPGASLPGTLSLDLWSWILDLDSDIPAFETPMVIEVKNTRSWLYAHAPELWELLVKAADLATQRPVLPVLVCCWSGPTAWWMAYDVGFFTARMQVQVFSPTIDEADFEGTRNATGLAIARHSGALQTLTAWFGSDLRKNPPSPPPRPGEPWYRRQVERFQHLAPVILSFDRLASPNLSGSARRGVFEAFRARVNEEAEWELRRGW